MILRSESIKPLLLDLTKESDLKTFLELRQDSCVEVFDSIYAQMRDFFSVKYPNKDISSDEMEELVNQKLNGLEQEKYGNWFYYPWSRRLVHTLPEEEFIEVRTNRNLYKITKAERAILSQKKVGIIGLSVGQSVAMTMAMERVVGELFIADFDTLELSNLNRIRTGIHQIGVSKVEIVAREISEIDPFIKINCFPQGVTEDNIDEFIKPLDCLIDECDQIQIKIECRRKARALGIPVLMDTSDRGLLDIERYDLEPERKLFHGLLENQENIDFKNITPDAKLSILAKVVGASSISYRLKASVLEMNHSIKAWPQLASAVVLGGAIVTDAVRRILLGESVKSGRFYIDLAEKILSAPSNQFSSQNQDKSIDWGKVIRHIKDKAKNKVFNTKEKIEPEILEKLVEAACLAPSSGNNQPWLWIYDAGILHLVLDEKHTQAFGDFKQIPSYISLGAAIENLSIAGRHWGIGIEINYFDLENDFPLVASFNFSKISTQTNELGLYEYLSKRKTDRSLFTNKIISKEIIQNIRNIIEGNSLGGEIQFIDSKEERLKLGKIVAEMDRIRLLHPIGHRDFFNNELRWTLEDALSQSDGIDLQSLSLSSSNSVGVRLLSDPEVGKLLNEIDGGDKLLETSTDTFAHTSHLAFITFPEFSRKNFLEGGQLMQRIWLYCTSQNISIHPVVSPLYFFYRHIHGENLELSPKEIDKIKVLRNQFREVFVTNDKNAEIIIFRLGYSENQVHNSVRRKLKEVLHITSL